MSYDCTQTLSQLKLCIFYIFGYHSPKLSNSYILQVFVYALQCLITWFFRMGFLIAFHTHHCPTFWTLDLWFVLGCTDHNWTFWVGTPFEIWVFLNFNVPSKCLILLEQSVTHILFNNFRSKWVWTVGTYQVLYAEVKYLLFKILVHTVQTNFMDGSIHMN